MNSLDVARVEREIAHLIAECPELADDEQLRADMIEGATDAMELLTRIVRHERHADAMVGAIGAEREALACRRERYEARKAALRSMAQRIMDAADLRKAELPIATLSVSNGRASVQISDETSIPDAFVRIKREPDKTAILAALKANENVPGAALSNGAPTLSVRVK